MLINQAQAKKKGISYESHLTEKYGREKALSMMNVRNTKATPETKPAPKRVYDFESYDSCMERGRYWLKKAENANSRPNEEATVAHTYFYLAREIRENEK